MRTWKTAGALLMVLALGACDVNEGPAERAGEDIDEAAEDAGDAMERGAERAEENIEDATQDR